jgi:hypothetical protein
MWVAFTQSLLNYCLPQSTSLYELNGITDDDETTLTGACISHHPSGKLHLTVYGGYC